MRNSPTPAWATFSSGASSTRLSSSQAFGSNQAAIGATLRDELPSVLDYLESVAPADGFVFGALAIADIAIAVHFANLRWSRTGVDLAAWPRTVAWIARVEQVPAVARLTTLAERAMAMRGAERRALYGEMGIPLTETSFAGKELRKGPMSV